MALRNILITGGNRGLGLAMASEILKRGEDHVILTARSPGSIPALPNSHLCTILKLDITNRLSRQDLLNSVDKIDVLVNNAAIRNSPESYDPQIARTTFATNIHATNDLTDLLAPRISSGGKIVNMSSAIGQIRVVKNKEIKERLLKATNWTKEFVDELETQWLSDLDNGKANQNLWPEASYYVSKLFLNLHTLRMAQLWPHLRVYAACPGWSQTDMGGPKGTYSAQQGASHILKVIDHEGDETAKFFIEGKMRRSF